MAKIKNDMAGGKGKIHEHPKWSSNNFSKRPQDAGRKRMLIGEVNKQLGALGVEAAKESEIKEAYLKMLNLTIREVQDIAGGENKNDYPLLYKLVAREMLGKRGADMLERLLDRAIGKATQRVDQQHDVKVKGDFSKFTKEELKMYYELELKAGMDDEGGSNKA